MLQVIIRRVHTDPSIFEKATFDTGLLISLADFPIETETPCIFPNMVNNLVECLYLIFKAEYEPNIYVSHSF